MRKLELYNRLEPDLQQRGALHILSRAESYLLVHHEPSGARNAAVNAMSEAARKLMCDSVTIVLREKGAVA